MAASVENVAFVDRVEVRRRWRWRGVVDRQLRQMVREVVIIEHSHGDFEEAIVHQSQVLQVFPRHQRRGAGVVVESAVTV